MFERRTIAVVGVIAAALVSLSASAQQSPVPDFIPDYTFQGTQLDEWGPIGAAEWRAVDGVITGTAESGVGMLLFDRSYENVAVFTRFRCDGECDAGILLRIEEVDDGKRGLLVAFEDGTINPYRVRIGEDGEIRSRELARGGGTSGGSQRADDGAVSPVLAAARDSLTHPVTIRPDAWNEVVVFLDGNEIRNHLNNVRNAVPGGEAMADPPQQASGGGGAIVPTPAADFGYGPVGLYVGSGTVAFDKVSTKNLLKESVELERTSSRFRIQRLDPFTYAWGADVADINGDGIQDVISGPFYYLGPDFRRRYEYYPARTFNPGNEYVNDMLTFANDWTGDGWVDVVRTERRPLVLHVNPAGESRLWDPFDILPDVCSETVVRADVDADGWPELVYVGSDGRVAYGKPDATNPTGPWLVRKISEPIVEGCNTHGVGTGDVNGDGLIDILSARGWWEQPVSGANEGEWIYHGDWFGRMTRSPQHPGGGEIAVYDFNGDGLNDVVTSLSAHGWGLAWYEQLRDGSGNISFEEHMIMGDFSTKNAGDVTFSQVHSGATLGDVDRDGILDFVSGKRHFSHLDSYADPDPYGEAVIYWYRTVRDAEAPGGVAFEPHLIHNKSGVGSEVKVVDLDQDGALDIVTAGTHGTFIFWGR